VTGVFLAIPSPITWLTGGLGLAGSTVISYGGSALSCFW
jgi:hypothetical protein